MSEHESSEKDNSFYNFSQDSCDPEVTEDRGCETFLLDYREPSSWMVHPSDNDTTNHDWCEEFHEENMRLTSTFGGLKPMNYVETLISNMNGPDAVQAIMSFCTSFYIDSGK